MTNLERLALLLQRVTRIEAGKTPEETIKRAVQEIKASKNTDQQVKSQLSKVKLSEEEMYGGAEELPTLTDYVRNKFAGEPSTKSWKAIELANIGRIDDLKKRQLYKKKFTDYTEDADLDAIEFDPSDLEDTEYDIENGITNKEIKDYFNNLTDADYLELYDDEIDFGEFDNGEDLDSDIEFMTGSDEKDIDLEECKRIIETSFDAKEIAEALELQVKDRIRRGNNARRNKAKMALGRRIASGRMPSLKSLLNRARRDAINFLKAKELKKPVNDMTIPEKARAEKIVLSKPALIARTARKFLPNVIKKAREHIKNMRNKK